MTKFKKKGFTIVELVIVIAVIAILAAVLIPTFSNIIKKANLSADKQAVREMNMALAEYSAANGYSAIPDVDTCMQILANAGYNTVNWTCLTEGYQVYWYRQDNKMILYNAKEAAIEYPDEYVGSKVLVTAENDFFIYNYNHVKAQQFDMSLSSAISNSDITGQSSLSNAVSITETGTNIKSNQAENVTKIENTISNNVAVSNSLRTSVKAQSNESLVYYATREVVSTSNGTAYASLQIAAVGSSANPVILQNSGNINENLYYLTVVKEEGASDIDIGNAYRAAGEYVYNIFDQITTGKINDNVTVIVEPGTVLDCSTCEWAPCKTFTGYFGTTDAANPVVISGARLTQATGYSATYQFTGSSSKYFLTGFFGVVYGNSTIENITFKNLTIDSPATDWKNTSYAASAIAAGKGNNRNTVGIIGGITDGWDGAKYYTGTVTLKNIIVESSCSIIGDGCVGGLVGYIGSGNGEWTSNRAKVLWDVVIDNCKVHSTVKSLDQASSVSYRKAGGVVGFFCRSGEVRFTMKDCLFDGSVDGYGSTAAAIGEAQYARLIKFEGTNDFASAKINGLGTAQSDQIAGVIYGKIQDSNCKPSEIDFRDSTIMYPAGLVRWNQVGTPNNEDHCYFN